MKKFLLIITLALSVISVSSCSSKDDETEVSMNNFENAEYVKSQMLGKWNYWGHKSPSCNCWSYNGDIYKGYYTFTSDNKYSFKHEVSNELQNGTYSITPATKTNNAYLTLTYQISGVNKYRTIILKDLTGNQAIVFESGYDQRYDKE